MIAKWSSRGAVWSACLYKQAEYYRLSERKHGAEVGAVNRPISQFPTESLAVAYFDSHIKNSFDVQMQRVEP